MGMRLPAMRDGAASRSSPLPMPTDADAPSARVLSYGLPRSAAARGRGDGDPFAPEAAPAVPSSRPAPVPRTLDFRSASWEANGDEGPARTSREPATIGVREGGGGGGGGGAGWRGGERDDDLLELSAAAAATVVAAMSARGATIAAEKAATDGRRGLGERADIEAVDGGGDIGGAGWTRGT